MTTRRDQRQAHVRPRPPSSGRPAPVKVKPRSPGPTRIASHRAIQRPGGLPVYWQIALVFGVVMLGALVLYVGVGGVGMVARGVSSTLGGFVSDVTSTPSPKATIPVVADSPPPPREGAAPGRPPPPAPPPPRGAVHIRRDDRPRRDGPAGAPGFDRPADQGLPDASRPATDRDHGGRDRRRPEDRHPGRADQGHQRLLGGDRRARRRVGPVR